MRLADGVCSYDMGRMTQVCKEEDIQNMDRTDVVGCDWVYVYTRYSSPLSSARE